MSILVTGTTGFIGSRVLQELLKRYKRQDIVIMSSRNLEPEDIAETRFLCAEGYVVAPDDLVNNYPDIDIIIHIGAFIPKSGTEADNIELSTGNIRNTESLLIAADKLSDLKKIIFTSTIDAYAATDDVLTEMTPTVPQTMYGWSKLYCEQMVKAFCASKGISHGILRLGHVYGEGEEKYRKVMPVMIKAAINQEEIKIYGDGEALRTFIYIDDVAKAIVRAIDFGDLDIINVVGNETVSINRLAEFIVELAGTEVKVVHIPSGIPNRNLVFDNGRLRGTLLDALTPLKDGLEREINYMKKMADEHCI